MLKTLILCGGKSTRMGQDKGSMQIQGRLWVQQAVRAAQIAKSEVYLSVNSEQIELYKKEIPDANFILDEFKYIEGPLKGIFTAHNKFPQSDWLVLACDMPKLTSRTILALLKAYNGDKTFDFYVFKDSQIQPFPGIFTATALKNVSKALSVEKPESNSVKGLLDKGNVYIVSIPEGKSIEMVNVNEPDDLKRIGL